MQNRIYLRALEPDDYKTSIQWRNDDEIWNMLGGPKYFVSEAYEKKWVEDAINDNKDIRLAICLKDSNLYIGNIYAMNINMINRSCRTHILIGDRNYWGNGIACEAYHLLARYLFNERGMNRLEALVLESNIASYRMHSKVGFVQEGILREAVYKNGAFQNQIIMSLLKTDYHQ